jgi:serine/threonine protein kinase
LLISCCCCNLFDDLENNFNEAKSKLSIETQVVLSKLKILGEGYWGKVFKIDDNSCLKIIKKPIGNEDDALEIKEYIVSDTLKKEIIEGIQKIEEVWVANNYIFIKSKFYQGPTLEKYIEEQKGYEKENKIKLVLEHFLQIVRALKNLHDLDFVHLDLKSDNCIFTNVDCNTLVIIDLGTARPENDQKPNYKEQEEIIGSIRNYSYNVAQAIIDKNGYSGKKYDIWCLGLILYHMYFGKELFPQYSFANILNAGFSFGSKSQYIRNVLINRKKFEITKDSKVTTLDFKSPIYTLLTNILTKEDDNRLGLDNIITTIEEYLNKSK